MKNHHFGGLITMKNHHSWLPVVTIRPHPSTSAVERLTGEDAYVGGVGAGDQGVPRNEDQLLSRPGAPLINTKDGRRSQVLVTERLAMLEVWLSVVELWLNCEFNCGLWRMC